MWGRDIIQYSIAIDFSDENLNSAEIIEHRVLCVKLLSEETIK